jgi:hypothetical protein
MVSVTPMKLPELRGWGKLDLMRLAVDVNSVYNQRKISGDLSTTRGIGSATGRIHDPVKSSS